MGIILTLTPSGPPVAAGRAGPAAHVILALDLSASMNDPEKYPVLTRAIDGLVTSLQATSGPDVLLSVVAFAYGSQVLLRAVPASCVSSRELIDSLDASTLRFGGYTDIVGALSKAGRLAYDAHQSDRALPVRICVLTDGRPQDQAGSRALMERIAKMPVDVDALAFGSDADVELLKGLFSGPRGGTVKHVRAETLEEAYTLVADGARSVVSKRALVRLALAPGVVGGGAHRFRPGRFDFGPQAFRGGRSFDADLGTLEAGRRYSLFFEVRVPQTDDDVTEIGRVTVRLPGWGAAREFATLLVVPRHQGAVPIERDPVVVEAREILSADGSDEDPEAMLQALRARRRIYVSERRDPYLLDVVDRAIAELEEAGNLEALSRGEQAALLAHTATAGSVGAAAGTQPRKQTKNPRR
jgi:uncharacterized protein YegL